MKQLMQKEFGGPEVLHLVETPRPQPGPRDLLVRVEATTVTFGDLTARNFAALTGASFSMPGALLPLARLEFGFRRPKKAVLGSEFSGVVEAVGAQVKTFRPGQAVFGYTGAGFGAAAEFLTIPEDAPVALRPEGLSPEEAASLVYGPLVAWPFLKQLALKPQDRVLIAGAAGTVGRALVQGALAAGARVDALASPEASAALLSLGVERVFDYRRNEVFSLGPMYRALVDVPGKVPFSQSQGILVPAGEHWCVSFKGGVLWRSFWPGERKTRLRCLMAPTDRRDFLEVAGALRDGIFRPCIDRVYSLEEGQEAHRRAQAKGRCGAVVLKPVHVLDKPVGPAAARPEAGL